MTLMHDKALTKVILREADVPTAPFTLVKACDSFNGFNSKTWKEKLGLDDNDEQPLDLFVKLNAEETSKGLSETLRARTADAANQAVKSLRSHFTGQDILVESFLDGREFSVFITGTGDDAEILGVTEMLCPEDSPPFHTWYAKTEDEEGKDWIERGVDGNEDEEVANAERVALKAWSAMECRDGGRVDVRSHGWASSATPHVMEINAIAGLRPGWSDLPLAAERNGIKYTKVIEKFVESARKRSAAPEVRLQGSALEQGR